MTTPRRPKRRKPAPEPTITDAERARRLAARGRSPRHIEHKLKLSRQAVRAALSRGSQRGRPRGDKHARLHVLTDEATAEWLRALAAELGTSVGEALRRLRLAMTEPANSQLTAADSGDFALDELTCTTITPR